MLMTPGYPCSQMFKGSLAGWSLASWGWESLLCCPTQSLGADTGCRTQPITPGRVIASPCIPVSNLCWVQQPKKRPDGCRLHMVPWRCFQPLRIHEMWFSCRRRMQCKFKARCFPMSHGWIVLLSPSPAGLGAPGAVPCLPLPLLPLPFLPLCLHKTLRLQECTGDSFLPGPGIPSTV